MAQYNGYNTDKTTAAEDIAKGATDLSKAAFGCGCLIMLVGPFIVVLFALVVGFITGG